MNEEIPLFFRPRTYLSQRTAPTEEDCWRYIRYLRDKGDEDSEAHVEPLQWLVALLTERRLEYA
jgi:hypothetical protein